jgi:bifunctional non-homologous end joining protein LigD
MPVAAPVSWDELTRIERSDAFTIGDVEALLRRAKTRSLKGWGAAEQTLPRIA